jgi:hypothetical protein
LSSPPRKPGRSPQLRLGTVICEVHHGGHGELGERDLGQRLASFETAAARPPQDEEFSQSHQSLILILRSARGARLEGRTTAMQPFMLPLRTEPMSAIGMTVQSRLVGKDQAKAGVQGRHSDLGPLASRLPRE